MLTMSVAALTSLALPARAAEPTIDPDTDFVFPQDPLVTTFTSSFGAPRSGGRSHQGNDLMAPKMTPVYAIADGVVQRIKDGGLSGRMISVEHASGWESWYMHLNNDTPGTDDGSAGWSYTLAGGIQEGVWVEAGRLIGFVGDSGNAEGAGAHTHFELHKGGRAVDPYRYLRAAHDRALAKVADRAAAALGGIIADSGSSQPSRGRQLG
jgi:murein DD-endopeptidase MepM/ murein hydrolase activator NlpD